MNRRQFLFLARRSGPHAVEISCERLHMRFLDLDVTAPHVDPSAGSEMSFAEPPATSQPGTAADFFRDLEEQLARSAAVRFVEAEWLHPPALRDAVNAVATRLGRRGIHVEFA